MKLPISIVAVCAAIMLPQAVSAQEATDTADAPQVIKGSMIYDSEGKKLGRVYSIRENDDGSRIIQVIYRQRMLSIPESMLTADEKGFTASSTRAELSKP